MPSSAYVTSVDIESGLSTGDTLLTTATIGGAVVAGATVGIGKVAPKSIKNKTCPAHFKNLTSRQNVLISKFFRTFPNISEFYQIEQK